MMKSPSANCQHFIVFPLEHFTSNINMPETNPDTPNPNPFVSLLKNFRLPFPIPNPNPFVPAHPENPPALADPQNPPAPADSDKPDVVKFADPTPAVPPPLKIESQDESAQSSAVVWQVYALGGYLLAGWIWGKWKEKRSNKKDQPSDENTSPPATA